MSEGSYGYVDKVEKDGKYYARKTFKYGDDKCAILRCGDLIELDILNLVNHPNILGAEEIIMDKNCENIEVILPLMKGDIWKLSLQSKPSRLKSYIYQLLCGLKYLKDNHIVHLDIKPANILQSEDKNIVKIADFGFSRINPSDHPIPYISKVVTIFWRSPEILLRFNYNYPADVWSMGIIFYYLITGVSGVNAYGTYDTMFALYHIFKFPDYMTVKANKRYEINFDEYFDKSKADKFWERIPSEYQELLRGMLTINPDQRLTPDECLKILSYKDECPKKCIEYRPFKIDPRGFKGERRVWIRYAFNKLNSTFVENKKLHYYKNHFIYIWILAVDILDRITTHRIIDTDDAMQHLVDAAITLSLHILTEAKFEQLSVEKLDSAICLIFEDLKARIYRPTIIEILHKVKENDIIKIVKILMEEQSIDMIYNI